MPPFSGESWENERGGECPPSGEEERRGCPSVLERKRTDERPMERKERTVAGRQVRRRRARGIDEAEG